MSGSGGAGARKAPYVLVIEDDENVRELWVDALEERGYQVLGIALAADAIWTLDRVRPDLIVLDIGMPRTELDGIEFLARLRDRQPRLDVPVLIVSGLGAAINPDTVRPLGVRAVLTKPVPVNVFVDTIAGILGSARA